MKEGCDMPSGENTCVRTASFRHEVVVLLAMSSMLVNHKKTPQTSFIYFFIYIDECDQRLMEQEPGEIFVSSILVVTL